MTNTADLITRLRTSDPAFVVVSRQKSPYRAIQVQATVHYDVRCSHANKGGGRLAASVAIKDLDMKLQKCHYCWGLHDR
jgi:hypothetical protein